MKVVVSLPIHTSPEVVLNQIKNIQYFIPNVTVIIHVSKFFEWNGSPEKLHSLEMDNVLINPERFPTKWGSGIHVDVHNSNFKYAVQNLEFDYFAMHSSNDLFIKPGVKNYMCNYEAGSAQWPLSLLIDWVKKDQYWGNKLKHKLQNSNLDLIKHLSEQDMNLSRIMKHLGITEIKGSQIEGTFYRKEIFKEIVKEIERFYSYTNEDSFPYSKEEFYYSTVASKFVKNFAPVYTFFNWRSPITIELIDNAIACNNQYNMGLDTYDLTNIFNVKRIERDLNDPVRKYITDFIK